MEAVLYSTFRNHLKDYMKKVNDEFEPLTVVNKNPDEDIVVPYFERFSEFLEYYPTRSLKELQCPRLDFY